VRPVAEALANPQVRIEKIYASDAARNRGELKDLWHAASHRGITVQPSDSQHLQQLTAGLGDHCVHQGLVAKLANLPNTSIADLVERVPLANLLALDCVQDPMNLGAALRCANACGIGALICPRDRTASLSAIAIKASAGAAAHTPVVYVTNLARTLTELKEYGYLVIALSASTASATLQLNKLKVVQPWVLVAGSEQQGIRRLVGEMADVTASIPMFGEVESLNVATACAVALYTLKFSQ
jgi:23S rRNA (guanosine2251-2'-O)-methyltransferase